MVVLQPSGEFLLRSKDGMQELIEVNELVCWCESNLSALADGDALCAHTEQVFVAGNSCCFASCFHFLIPQLEI